MATEKKTTIILKCDNPKCETVLTWVDQDPENVPDGFFRFTFEQRFVEKEGFKEFAFCSRYCSHIYDRTYVAPLSPREQARIMQANTAADQRIIKPEVAEQAPPPTDTEIKVTGGVN